MGGVRGCWQSMAETTSSKRQQNMSLPQNHSSSGFKMFVIKDKIGWKNATWAYRSAFLEITGGLSFYDTSDMYKLFFAADLSCWAEQVSTLLQTITNTSSLLLQQSPFSFPLQAQALFLHPCSICTIYFLRSISKSKLRTQTKNKAF